MHSEETTSVAGDWLRSNREEAGISQAQLADMAGISQQIISKLERGEVTQPRPATMHALRMALEKVLRKHIDAPQVYSTGHVVRGAIREEINRVVKQQSNLVSDQDMYRELLAKIHKIKRDNPQLMMDLIDFIDAIS